MGRWSAWTGAITASVAVVCAGLGGADQRPTIAAPDPPPQLRLPDRKVTFQLAMARLPDVLSVLVGETGMAALADAYPDDATAPVLNVEGVPLEVAVRQLARLYRREVSVVDHVLVFRDATWFTRLREPNPLFKWRTPPSGWGQVDVFQEAGEPTGLVAEVRDISVRLLALRVARLLKREFAVDASIADRRVSLSATKITPTSLAGALEFLLNGSAGITLRQTRDQRSSEDAQYLKAQDDRSAEQKLSDELKKDLARILKPEQQQALHENRSVEVPFDELPPDVRRRAERYADQKWTRVAATLDKVGALDRSRGLTLSIRPEPFLKLNVQGVLSDGTSIAF